MSHHRDRDSQIFICQPGDLDLNMLRRKSFGAPADWAATFFSKKLPRVTVGEPAMRAGQPNNQS
jgi:hypothetical protein